MFNVGIVLFLIVYIIDRIIASVDACLCNVLRSLLNVVSMLVISSFS